MKKLWGTIALVCLLATPVLADGYMSLVEYSTAHDYNCWIVHAHSFVTLELGLFDPVNTTYDGTQTRPVTNVQGFECRLWPEEGVIITSIELAAPGQFSYVNGSIEALFDDPVPVTDPGKTVLAYVNCYMSSEVSFELPEEAPSPCYLNHNTGIRIHALTLPLFPGLVAYKDADDPSEPWVPANHADGRDFSFFMLQDPEVGGQDHAWDSIKAIYR